TSTARSITRHLLTAPFTHRLIFSSPAALSPEAFQQDAGRLVIAPLLLGQFRLGGHQLATECLGQDRLHQLLDPCRGCRPPLLDGVGQSEKGLDAADDFALLGEGRKRYSEISKSPAKTRVRSRWDGSAA